jgi:hypothetical protein
MRLSRRASAAPDQETPVALRTHSATGKGWRRLARNPDRGKRKTILRCREGKPDNAAHHAQERIHRLKPYFEKILLK